MGISVANLIDHLSSSALVSDDELDRIRPDFEDKMEEDAGGLLIQLVQKDILTDYQAACLREGDFEKLTLGEYNILRPIGKGGMAEVFEAKHADDDTLVALKVLDREAAKKKEASFRFDREVQAAAKLNHPNIVTAYDSKMDGETNFLVMEYVDGPNLADYVEKHNPIPVDDAVNFIYQAACGLEHAHEQRIVHRDIKPHNLLLCSDGTVKILDMGLVRFDNAPKLGRRADSADRLTQMGVMLGTADYMAPEQSNDPRNASYQSDIYSLGCTLYFLLTGKGPFDRDTAMATMLAHQTDPVPDLRWVRKDVPQTLQEIFELMVAKELRDRYETMSDLISDLEMFMQDPTGKTVLDERSSSASGIGIGSGIHSRGRSVRGQSAPEVKRHAPTAARACGITGGVLGGIVLGLLFWTIQFPPALVVLQLVGGISEPLAANPPFALACYGAIVGGMVGVIAGELLAAYATQRK